MKRALRRKIIAARNRLSSQEIAEKSKAIATRLFSLPAFKRAEVVMFFLSYGSEVNTIGMAKEAMSNGKQVVAPLTVPKRRELIPSLLKNFDSDLAPGLRGIPEPRLDRLRPVDPKEIDLLVVPGVAFDEKGNRMGYGGGYYDRFFERLRPGVPLVAICFELQVIDEVPVAEWDQPVDFIITEDRVLSFSRQTRNPC